MTATAEAIRQCESIISRQEIDAPAEYVSIYHETTAQAIDGIDQHGLVTGHDDKNMNYGPVARINRLIDGDCPDDLKAHGLSRMTNIYGYPYLHEGHGLTGADQRFIPKDEHDLRHSYEAMRQYAAMVLDLEGISSADEYVRMRTDPDWLREQYPGEVLELKVDPEKCFVGDLTEYTNVVEAEHRWGYEPSDGKRYWDSVVTLKDFLQWYRKPEWSADGNSFANPEQFRDGEPVFSREYYVLAGAPEDMPGVISQPEILIPEDVPQEHIRVVQ